MSKTGIFVTDSIDFTDVMVEDSEYHMVFVPALANSLLDYLEENNLVKFGIDAFSINSGESVIDKSKMSEYVEEFKGTPISSRLAHVIICKFTQETINKAAKLVADNTRLEIIDESD